jgi:hypothetical protein
MCVLRLEHCNSFPGVTQLAPDRAITQTPADVFDTLGGGYLLPGSSPCCSRGTSQFEVLADERVGL